MGAGSFPIDLVLLGMVAAFLVLRLRSVLGKRTGFERENAAGQRTPASVGGRILDAKPDQTGTRLVIEPRVLPDVNSTLGQGLVRIQAIDSAFSPARFLDGAEAAFRLIVVAFARGDRAALRPLLTTALMEVFDAAIAEREAAKQTQHTTLHSVRSAIIETVDLAGNRADIAVRFVSDQVSHTDDATGATIVGTEALTEISDVWTFERELSSRDPAWRLAAAQNG